ncbi:hypothetical protein BAUCODRAFT_80044 [Baudoinia panamericana UAMH 10762]|uniref:SAM domain-containing protein n=1 Tax=Baudoinia panamericana (strain UAMH 10762) TaxID=717646 RepID=M2M3T2_BAUPA|nr:uncharacterized protein BAUCODRAFT_80044 [Baudoinia panamericana UAMH 10762]EMC91231.1 hypothetical protein BAUCODRAFT_80044 [Baudoinia panamericana UAMH 10762]
MLLRHKTASIAAARSTPARPLSVATEILDTDGEDESDFEDFTPDSPKGSYDTDERRTSQTTLSSYDEAPTPSSSQSRGPFEMQPQAVEGPRGPHLFRASQTSTDLEYEYAMQMSPLLPKEMVLRTGTAFSDVTVTTPITRQNQLEQDYSIASALHQALNLPPTGKHAAATSIRGWSHEQVVEWMLSANLDESIIDCFEHHDVDGTVLMDLEFEDLKELDIQSFGKRHQVWNAICELRGVESQPSPQPTPFEDVSRPCTRTTRRSPSRARDPHDEASAEDERVNSPSPGKKRRGRKPPKQLDIVTPGESVSIVAIEQLLPKPHKCAKGERCAKWRKQQRELQQLKDDDGLGRFPISPGMGGRIVVRGDPGNAMTAENVIPNVRMLHVDEQLRPDSHFIPSVVASSDVLGPDQLPDFALHADMLEQLDKRDPQDNVRQFLNFQHLHSPAPPLNDAPLSPVEGFPGNCNFIDRSISVPPPSTSQAPVKRTDSAPSLFPEQHFQAYPSLHHQDQTTGSYQHLRQLPRLSIPTRLAATQGLAATNPAVPESAASMCRSITASPGPMVSPSHPYRFGTPASEMDVPVTAVPSGPIARDTSASVPPNMQFRVQQHSISRSHSRAAELRRPSIALPAVHEGEVFTTDFQQRSTRPSISSYGSPDSKSSCANPGKQTARDPAHVDLTVKQFGYGSECTHAGWMKKRKTKMLRHDWQDAHFRLQGTNLSMYPNARLSTAAIDKINVDEYAVACSSVGSNSKITAAMKALKLMDDAGKKSKDGMDPTAFAFQLVPTAKEGESKRLAANGKTHHFAVKTKDDRIDWMRELMLAKALKAKGDGYDVEVNGVQA